MGKFKVGDKARLNCARGRFKAGDIVKVIETDFQDEIFPYLIESENETGWTSVDSLEKVITKKQRIESLEKRVEELEKLVEGYFKLPVEPSTVDVEDKPKTPNQLRAEIIEKAKGFIEKSKNSNGHYYVEDYGTHPWVCNVEFFVNKEKRAIVALLRGIHTKNVYTKGIAKCNPSDVFNEHIGKAIALGRALGLDVSEFEGAVQPTFAKGQIIEGATERNPGVIKERECYGVRGDDVYTMSSYLGWLHAPYTKIINDTNAIYGEVE